MLKGIFKYLDSKRARESDCTQRDFGLLCAPLLQEKNLPQVLIMTQDSQGQFIGSVFSSLDDIKQVLLSAQIILWESTDSIFSVQGGSVQITLFLKKILFTLGCSQASNVDCVLSHKPQAPTPELCFVCQTR